MSKGGQNLFQSAHTVETQTCFDGCSFGGPLGELSGCWGEGGLVMAGDAP